MQQWKKKTFLLFHCFFIFSLLAFFGNIYNDGRKKLYFWNRKGIKKVENRYDKFFIRWQKKFAEEKSK